MASALMVILDPSTISLETAINDLINTHGDPRKVATWRAQSIGNLVDNFHRTLDQLDWQKEHRKGLLENIQADRHDENLCPLHIHPLHGLRVKQEAQIAHCVSVRSDARQPGIPSVPTLADAIVTGPLKRVEVIGAYVILESALASIRSEKDALIGKWWRDDGSWDDTRGNIQEIREALALL